VLRVVGGPGLALLLVLAPCGAARAQDDAGPTTVFEVTLPGGIEAALAAVDDHVPADRSQFLLEFIRRTYSRPSKSGDGPGERDLARLLAHLRRASEGPAGDANASDTLPLPLSPRVWTDVVFGGRATTEGLLLAILESRPAALFYFGLLFLDDETRAWIGASPALVAELSGRHVGAFLVAAPALRVAGGRVRCRAARRANRSGGHSSGAILPSPRRSCGLSSPRTPGASPTSMPRRAGWRRRSSPWR
jgi:hypothetical protein